MRVFIRRLNGSVFGFFEFQPVLFNHGVIPFNIYLPDIRR
jgi:hypothetical protein